MSPVSFSAALPSVDAAEAVEVVQRSLAVPTVFDAVQLMVGTSLVVGYRTRLMATVGMFYLGALIVMGMTRYAPFLFGLLVPVIGGRLLSLDRARNVTPRFGLYHEWIGNSPNRSKSLGDENG